MREKNKDFLYRIYFVIFCVRTKMMFFRKRFGYKGKSFTVHWFRTKFRVLFFPLWWIQEQRRLFMHRRAAAAARFCLIGRFCTVFAWIVLFIYEVLKCFCFSSDFIFTVHIITFLYISWKSVVLPFQTSSSISISLSESLENVSLVSESESESLESSVEQARANNSCL